MPLRGFAGIWRPLKRPGRARGGGGDGKEKTTKTSVHNVSIVFCFSSFFFPPPWPSPAS